VLKAVGSVMMMLCAAGLLVLIGGVGVIAYAVVYDASFELLVIGVMMCFGGNISCIMGGKLSSICYNCAVDHHKDTDNE